MIDIKCSFFSDLVRIGEHSGTCHVIFMFHGLKPYKQWLLSNELARIPIVISSL